MKIKLNYDNDNVWGHISADDESKVFNHDHTHRASWREMMKLKVDGKSEGERHKIFRQQIAEKQTRDDMRRPST